ncbi:MAG TPA: hypothetical protein VFS43_14070 [Polyangiaceae bacterium]|nr:hypothetical protein [Polyangiaceae bacterium]
MMMRGLIERVSRFGLAGALLAPAASLSACADALDDREDVASAEMAIGYPGDNNLPPFAIDSDPLKRSVTNGFAITTPGLADPLQLCESSSVTATGCTMRPEWQSWMNADPTNRVHVMKGLAKCAVAPGFFVRDASGSKAFPGQWNLYPSWSTSRLVGQDKRERVSSCLLSLLNGNNQELRLCIIGPGGAPFSDACSDPSLTIREGGYYGDLFANEPKAYVAGPDAAEPLTSGRACFGAQGNYCCAEGDTACQHRIVLTGAIVGSPEQNFANKRCNAPLVQSGANWHCPSFFSTREPGRNYTNVFTAFVPPAE